MNLIAFFKIFFHMFGRCPKRPGLSLDSNEQFCRGRHWYEDGLRSFYSDGITHTKTAGMCYFNERYSVPVYQPPAVSMNMLSFFSQRGKIAMFEPVYFRNQWSKQKTVEYLSIGFVSTLMKHHSKINHLHTLYQYCNVVS